MVDDVYTRILKRAMKFAALQSNPFTSDIFFNQPQTNSHQPIILNHYIFWTRNSSKQRDKKRTQTTSTSIISINKNITRHPFVFFDSIDPQEKNMILMLCR